MISTMVYLKYTWGYDATDKGKKTVVAIIYKYLKEEMFEGKEHVRTAVLSVKFAMKSSTLHRCVTVPNIDPFQLSATLKQGTPLKVTSTNQAPGSADQ